MKTYARHAYTVTGILLILAALAVAFSAPLPALAQGQSTPTLEAPSPRTPPPGPRATPVPASVPPTPGPTGAPPESPAPESTPLPTPEVLPVTGSNSTPRGTASNLLIIVLLGVGLMSLALGFNLQRRDNNS